MISAKDIPEPGEQDIIDIVRKGKLHRYFNRVDERAKIMRSWYNAQEHEVSGHDLEKSRVVTRSPIESSEEYEERLNNFDLLPLEHKFFQTQQRIYDENNVQRTYPDSTREFWKAKEAHFDDCGDEIDVFYRDKVLFTKEIEGFGAVCLDLAMKNGEPLSDNGSAIPYPYIVQAHELKNYKTWYGHLQYLVIAQIKGEDEEWRVFTPNFIYVFENQGAEPRKIPHRFGKTPAILLKGAVDSQSGFKIGQPRRWNLTGLYKAASELFYDLKKGSRLFGHPIPAYPESMIKRIAGAYDEDDDVFRASVIKDELGMVIPYPDDNPPSRLFYQADMQGLQHLRGTIFEDLINLIYQIAQVRDKSKVVHNASGRSKQFDSVEEQGLLAQTAMDMEVIERDIQNMMATVRGEEVEDFNTVYSKHHDLSSADEIWKQFIEGVQYGQVPNTVKKYQISQYLHKKSAPEEDRRALMEELEQDGFPITREQVDALKDRIDDRLLALKAWPELKDEEMVNRLQEQLNNLSQELDSLELQEPQVEEPINEQE